MKNNQLQLVTFEQAERLKKAGFDWPTERFFVDCEDRPKKTAYPFWCENPSAYPKEPTNWNALIKGGEQGNTSTPSVALAIKWFRDVKHISGDVSMCGICNEKWCNNTKDSSSQDYNTFDQAESALLDELLMTLEK